MRINGNYEDALYGRRQAFTKLPEDQETGAVPAPDKGTSGVVHETGRRQAFTKLPEDQETGAAPDKEMPGVVYEKGHKSPSKLYTSDGSRVGERHNPKRMTVKDNEVRFDNHSYYQFTGKDGREHTVLSRGSSLRVDNSANFGTGRIDKEAADYADFWESLAKGITFGLEEKYSTAEIRKKLEEAGIQHGFFTVTVGNRSQTYYLSQNENVGALRPKESYDKYYNLLTSGRAFELDKFQPEQTVTIGGKDYVLKDDKSIDIEYGAELYSSGGLK